MRKDLFNIMPDVRYNRSDFDLSHDVKTSINAGTLYPIDWQEVLPGDTFKCKLTAVMRVSSSFIKPVIDNAYLEMYHFFVPLRLVQADADKIFGSSTPLQYSTNTFSSAAVSASPMSISQKSVGDYLGLPIGTVPRGVSILPFRAFAKIYNDWFRNENISSEVGYSLANTVQSTEAPNNSPWSPSNYTGMCPKVSKRRDYFTSALPKPQKGPAIDLPLGTSAPVVGGSTDHKLDVRFKYGPKRTYNDYNIYMHSADSTRAPDLLTSTAAMSSQTAMSGDYYSNMEVDLSSATAASVNDLRTAFALQKMLEKDARYGTRYNEYLRGHFGVTSPDARLQISEYLGGGKIPLSVQQVAQTSATGTTGTAQGNVAGYSFTNGYSKFNKGFVEHGYIITCVCVRPIHTYQQGINCAWFRKNREDFYDPIFANLGEQPIYTAEIFASGLSDVKQSVFGYKEAWNEYRHIPNRISGQLRNGATGSLSVWHFGDWYANQPYLNSSFIEEGPGNINRCLSVDSDTADQFILDMWFDESAIRVMPKYSVPGLIDHH